AHAARHGRGPADRVAADLGQAERPGRRRRDHRGAVDPAATSCVRACPVVLISILIPAYARPDQLAQALKSIAQQHRSLIGEIIIGDDSPRACWAANQAAITESGLSALIEYLPSETSKGTYPNQWFLGSRARCDHLLFLHNDDQLCPGALGLLAQACASETDSRVELWFGTQLIMDEAGVVDAGRSEASDRWY